MLVAVVVAHFIHDISALSSDLCLTGWAALAGTEGWEDQLNKYHLYCNQPGPGMLHIPTALILGNLSCINSFEKQKAECTEYLLNTSYNIVWTDNWTI